MHYSEEQRYVINFSADRDQVVIAAPGAGKTTCILGRIQHLRNIGKPLDKLCYLTYSKKMAEEANQKLSDENVSGMFHAGTIDSLCWKLLESKFTKHESSENFTCEPNQIINRMTQALHADQSWQPCNLDHIFLDEAQDLDMSRYTILKRLVNMGTTLTIVGDPRQAIYQSLFDADPRLMSEIRPNAIKNYLTKCFRCSPEIIKFVNRAFKLEGPHHPEIVSSRDPVGIKPNYIKLHAEIDNLAICRDEVIEVVSRRIKQLVKKGSRPGQIMVVCPSVKNSSLHLLNRIRTTLGCVGIPSRLNKSEIDFNRNSRRREESTDAVYMGTVHSVKGSECRHLLFLNFYVGNGALHRVDKNNQENKDYKSLLYVGCTRAKDTLDLFETCHMPKKCESIEFMRTIGDACVTIAAREYDLQPIHVEKSNLTFKSQAVTDVLHSLPAAAWDKLELIPLPPATKCPGSLDMTYSSPDFISQSNDADLYGIFMEMVIVRQLICKQASASYILKQFTRLPVYLSKAEFEAIKRSKIEAVGNIPDIKFTFSDITKDDLYAFVKQYFSASRPSVTSHFKKSLHDLNVYVSTCEASFYQNVNNHAVDLHRIKDITLDTADIIESIWNVMLMKTFHDTQLGLYWIVGNNITSNKLLPKNSMSSSFPLSWSDYLQNLSLIFDTFGIAIESYQYPLKTDIDNGSVLNGIADVVTKEGTLIDIKCSNCEHMIPSLYNRSQLIAYRSMLGSSNLPEHTYILSALSLNIYQIPADSRADKQVIDILKLELQGQNKTTHLAKKD